MSDYIYQEYPKWLYQRRHGGRIFNSAKETRWLWLFGWRKKPFPPKQPGFMSGLKGFWQEWEWFLKLIAAVLVIAAAAVKLLP